LNGVVVCQVMQKTRYLNMQNGSLSIVSKFQAGSLWTTQEKYSLQHTLFILRFFPYFSVNGRHFQDFNKQEAFLGYLLSGCLKHIRMDLRVHIKTLLLRLVQHLLTTQCFVRPCLSSLARAVWKVQ